MLCSTTFFRQGSLVAAFMTVPRKDTPRVPPRANHICPQMDIGKDDLVQRAAVATVKGTRHDDTLEAAESNELNY